MARSFWNWGWQEGSFERIRAFVGSSPAWYQRVASSDVVEDAYLLTVASTLFLRDEDSGAKRGPAGTGLAPPPSAPHVLGAAPFVYERCVGAGKDRETAFASASGGAFGALHREAAREAGSPEAWSQALSALGRAGGLRPSFPLEPGTHDPDLTTFGEDLKACNASVLSKAVHAFKIGFGLWGRWESA